MSIKTAMVQFRDICKLRPDTWLNDEVGRIAKMRRLIFTRLSGEAGSNDLLLCQIINFYMELISDRSQKNQTKYPAIHCFNTFFCTTLLESGYAKLKRWTKRVDIFSKDMVLIPVNSSLHWTLAVFDFRKKRLAMYDSLGGNNARLVKVCICLSYIYYVVQRHTYTGIFRRYFSTWKTSIWTKRRHRMTPQLGTFISQR